MKRLIRKSKLYDAFQGKEYVEIFENPTSKEIEDTKNSDTYQSIRGVIELDGRLIIWPGSYLHYDIVRLTDKPIEIGEALRFAYYPDRNAFVVDCGMYEEDTVKNMIKDNLNTLKKIGNTNKIELWEDPDVKIGDFSVDSSGELVQIN